MALTLTPFQQLEQHIWLSNGFVFVCCAVSNSFFFFISKICTPSQLSCSLLLKTPRIWPSKGLKFLKRASCHSKWSPDSLFISICLLVPWHHCILFHGVCPLIPTCLGGEALRAAPLEWGTHLNGTQGWASLAQSTVSSPVANCNHWRNTSCNYTLFFLLFPY